LRTSDTGSVGIGVVLLRRAFAGLIIKGPNHFVLAFEAAESILIEVCVTRDAGVVIIEVGFRFRAGAPSSLWIDLESLGTSQTFSSFDVPVIGLGTGDTSSICIGVIFTGRANAILRVLRPYGFIATHYTLSGLVIEGCFAINASIIPGEIGSVLGAFALLFLDVQDKAFLAGYAFLVFL
jgi:hypothetical protein